MGREREWRGLKKISDSEDEGSWGYGGGRTRGGTIGHVQDSIVGGRRGEAGRPLVIDRSGGERRWIDWRVVSEEAAEVVAGVATATVMSTATEATTMTEGEWGYPPATRVLVQDQGRDPPGAAAGRVTWVPPPRERQQQYQVMVRGKGSY